MAEMLRKAQPGETIRIPLQYLPPEILGDDAYFRDVLGAYETINNDRIRDSRVLLLGEQSNPYQYLIHADWLLVPSFHEAAPMVFDEATLMGIKVITTNTTSAEEMIGYEHGIICENSTDGIADALKNVGKSARSTMRDADNQKQRKQVDALLGQ